MANAAQVWIVGPEDDNELFRRLRAALRELGFEVDDRRWGVGGSQEVSQWKLHSPQGAVIVEAETYVGLSVRGPEELVREIRRRYEAGRCGGRVDAQTHARAVRAMFARIAGVYDFMNHLLSLNRDRRWRQRLVARIDPGAREVLDACAGTGDLALACLEAGEGRLVLVSDFCPEMLVLARRKGLGDVLAADALRLPLADGSVDAAMVAFGVRNLADVRAGIGELARVLRPGGQLLVLEFFRAGAPRGGDRPNVANAADPADRGSAPLVRAWLRATVPLLGRLFARDGAAYSYLPSSMDRFLTVPEFRALLSDCGLHEIAVERQTLGIAHLVVARKARSGKGEP